MPGIFDRLLKPQPKAVTQPVDIVVPINTPTQPTEDLKPVEVVAVPEPDFTKSLAGTPFETPISLAKKYFEAASSSGEVTEEMKTKLTAFAEVSGILSEGWKAEQEATEAAEKLKLPSEKLKDALKSGISQNSTYDVKLSLSYFDQGIDGIVNEARERINQEEQVSEKKPTEIIKELFDQKKLTKNIDMGNLVQGSFGLLGTPSEGMRMFNPSERIAMLKSLGVVPSDTPEKFPLGEENAYFVKLLTKGGSCVPNEVQADQKTTEFRKTTKIEGVYAVISIASRYLTNTDNIGNLGGYPYTSGFRLELSPDFYVNTLVKNDTK